MLVKFRPAPASLSLALGLLPPRPPFPRHAMLAFPLLPAPRVLRWDATGWRFPEQRGDSSLSFAHRLLTSSLAYPDGHLRLPKPSKALSKAAVWA